MGSTLASYTYGHSWGYLHLVFLTPFQIQDRKVWIVVIMTISLIVLVGNLSPESLGGYQIDMSYFPSTDC